MPYSPILATLGYVFNPARTHVLMVHRTARAGDAHYGKYNGLGGKLEPNEDVAEGLRRELREEAGIEATQIQLAGTISWPGFGKGGEDWFGFLFRVFEFTGEVKELSPEGPLQWVPIENVMNLPLWDGDKLFLPLIFQAEAPPFHGIMPYLQGKMQDWKVTHILQ